MMEVAEGEAEAVVEGYRKAGLACSVIGSTSAGPEVTISVAGQPEVTGVLRLLGEGGVGRQGGRGLASGQRRGEREGKLVKQAPKWR